MRMTKSIVNDLIRPEAYPEPTKNVEMLQTHISYIFIADDYVYKIKKPVNFGFLDFSTLDKRLFYCQKEIELNKRLSPDVYLDVIPITDEGERLALGGKGETVDYAVKMRKIPMDRLMISLLKKGKLTHEMIEKVSKKIAEFHEEAATSPEIEKFGSITVIKTNTDENFEQTKNYIGKSIKKTQYESINNYTNEFYKTKKQMIKNRMTEQRIKDCHGDLHMEHVCLTDPIIIFDCIEFNDRFRYSDTAADIAFLAMDLDFHGRDDLSKILLAAYVRYSNDNNIYDMLNFYKIYRAYVRGKVIGFQLDDPQIPNDKKKKALDSAKKYFELAFDYVKEEKANE
jgi:aminoglycoside phosphotransferase family enzyme